MTKIYNFKSVVKTQIDSLKNEINKRFKQIKDKTKK